MATNLETTLTAVRAFINDNGGDASKVDAATRLLQDGHLDSFALVELIGELERLLSISLPDGSLIPEDFESVEVLHARLQALG